MEYEQILVEQRGRVRILTLNRPEKLNAWTGQMMTELRDAIEAAGADPSVGAIVLTGAGRGFCAGADIAGFEARLAAQGANGAPAAPEPPRETLDWVRFIQQAPRPTIAAVNGVAVGVGVTAILPFDIRIGSPEARFGFAFVKLVRVPELGSSHLLPQMVGMGRARDWCLTGRMVPAEEAREAGLVSEVVPIEQLVARAVEIGELMAANAPRAMTRIREVLIRNADEADFDAVIRIEDVARAEAGASWEHREAITAFRERRQPDFSPRA